MLIQDMFNGEWVDLNVSLKALQLCVCCSRSAQPVCVLCRQMNTVGRIIVGQGIVCLIHWGVISVDNSELSLFILAAEEQRVGLHLTLPVSVTSLVTSRWVKDLTPLDWITLTPCLVPAHHLLYLVSHMSAELGPAFCAHNLMHTVSEGNSDPISKSQSLHYIYDLFIYKSSRLLTKRRSVTSSTLPRWRGAAVRRGERSGGSAFLPFFSNPCFYSQPLPNLPLIGFVKLVLFFYTYI